jgi:hypothetical protein
VQQKLDAGCVILPDGCKQRRDTILVLDIDVGPFAEQILDNLSLAVVACIVKIGSAFDQLVDFFRVLF